MTSKMVQEKAVAGALGDLAVQRPIPQLMRVGIGAFVDLGDDIVHALDIGGLAHAWRQAGPTAARCAGALP